MKLITLDFFEKRLSTNMPNVALLDIGVSGGIDQKWRSFGQRLNGIGVDPLIAEVTRLSQCEENTNFSYLAAFVQWKNWNTIFPPEMRGVKDNNSLGRSSASHAMSLHDYTQEQYNAGEAVAHSTKYMEIDEIVSLMPEQRIDFVKSDTDGFDFPALLSGEAVFASNQVMGVIVESNFHGPTHPYANNFANIDRFMRSNGFTLYDITSYKYSRAMLPDRFEYEIAAQTKTGCTQWGDATYFRDFCSPNFTQIAGWEPDSDQIIRMAMLLELFGQVDSVAELLIQYSGALELGEDLTVLLDALVKKYRDPLLGQSYEELIANFKSDFTQFFPKL